MQLELSGIVTASGSASTHSGLIVGLALERVNIPVFGICVRRNAFEQRKRVSQVTELIFQLLEINEKINPVDATSDWVNGLKQNDKPIALLFGGGLDSIFVLDCMIKSNCPPDYLLIYTSNPFDNYDFFCGGDMEPRYALRYADEIIRRKEAKKAAGA